MVVYLEDLLLLAGLVGGKPVPAVLNVTNLKKHLFHFDNTYLVLQ